MNVPITLTLNLLDDSILLNEGVLNVLDRPRQVQILINKKEQMLLLRACTTEDSEAVVILQEDQTNGFEISGRTFLRRLRQVMGWADDMPRVCRGDYLPSHHAIRFDLKTATPVSSVNM